MTSNTFKSIWAVVAGFLTVIILSVATDMVLESTGILPSQSRPELFTGLLLLLAFVYRSIYAMVGGYVTATLAPTNTMRHVTILGILGTLGGIAGVAAG